MIRNGMVEPSAMRVSTRPETMTVVADRCPMPANRHRHRITDRDGVISCILCHQTYERDGTPSWDRFGWAAP